MAYLNTQDKKVLEKLFQMESGYVLNFSDRTISEFFRDDLNINIYSKKYDYGSGSKANRMRGFWLKEKDSVVADSIIKLINYIENQIVIEELDAKDFPNKIIKVSKDIANNLLKKKETESKAVFKNGNIKITLQKDVFDHVQDLLNDGHYFNAVEESYKIVRKKLKDVTGSEKATNAFSNKNYEKIFGHEPITDAEKDFFEGVKFLHMAIQFLRNEKSHTPASPIDINLAIHYISLASLAYDLISKKVK